MAKFSKQRKNLNRHTDVGTRQLRASIERDGWIGAITVAADGETFDGSNRIEVGAGALENAIVVESDGTKPVVVKRTDIPNTDDPRAVRLGFTANQIAAVDLEYDSDAIRAVLANDPVAKEIADEDYRIRQLLNSNNPNTDDLWQGMPEHISEEIRGTAICCLVRFRTEDDRKEFEKLLGYKLQHKGKTYSAWFPQQYFDQLGRGKEFVVES